MTPRQQGIRLDGYCVRLFLPTHGRIFRLFMLVRRELILQQVLMEGAFVSNVQHLNAATDTENRQAAFAGLVEESQFHLIARPV